MMRKTSPVLAILLTIGCASMPGKPGGTREDVPIDAYLSRGARTMWIAAHPDDELFAGALLARSSIYHGNPLYFLVLNHGDGGECCIEQGCLPDLPTLRKEELKKAVAHYRATLQIERYFNAPLPTSSFPERHVLYAIWKHQEDPVRIVAEAVRRFRPDVVLTFDPSWGATGHPEHQLASRLASTGVRQAADSRVILEGLPPHRVARFYHVLNRYWLLMAVGRADPGPVTETWDATLPCTDKLSCLNYMLCGIRHHRSQKRDMDKVRTFSSAFETVYLRRVDPYSTFWNPAGVD